MKMHLLLFCCAWAAAIGTARAQQPPQAKDAPLDTSYLRNHAETRGFMLGRPVKPKPTPDGKAVLFLRAQPRVAKLRLYEFDVATGKTRELLTPEQVLKGAEEHLSPEEKARRERQRVSVGGFTDYQLSDDGAHILVSLSGKLYLVQRSSGDVRELNTGTGTLLDPKFAPDGKSVAYVLDHDVNVLDLATQKVQRMTTGGSERLTHGLAEFVAQEEMSRFSGYWWSPDSKFIAYEEADTEGVEIWYVSDAAKPEQPAQTSYYPRPGKKNVKVRLGIIPATGGDTVWVQFDRFEYLARVHWGKGGLVYQTQSRDQTVCEVGQIDPKTGLCRERQIYSDRDWLGLDAELPRSILYDGEPGFLNGLDTLDPKIAPAVPGVGGRFLKLSTSNGSRLHLRVLTRMERFLSYDDKRSEVYVVGSEDPTQAHVYRVGMKDGRVEQLTHEPGLHSATFAKDHSIYVLTSTALGRMPRSTVHRTDGSLVGELPSVAEEPPFVPRAELLKVGEGQGFYAVLIRPRNFEATRRYPVIVHVYGGPGHNQVMAAMGMQLLDQWLADQGFLVVALDGRGTPGRGRDWERAISKHFGSVPLEDQVAGIKALGKRCPEMDLDRVGIYGWSFGGYMSALAVLRQPDVFKAAVAGAPVVDWLDYDTHYTERYLGLPETDAAAYKEGSLLTYAADLKRPLLLVHGTADDNVYFRHTLKLADALFRAGKEFELLPLSGLTHMVPDPVVTQRLWSRIAGHFQQHLGKPREAATR